MAEPTADDPARARNWQIPAVGFSRIRSDVWVEDPLGGTLTMSLKDHFSRTPAAFQAVSTLFELLGSSEDPRAFIAHARRGDIEAAFDTIDRPNEDLHREVSAMRKLSLDAGEDAPEPSEEERDILSP